MIQHSGTTCVGGLVVAGGAAGFAVHEAVFTDADVELRTAEAAELIALAGVFRLLALGAAEFGLAGCRGHTSNLALSGAIENMPLVTCILALGSESAILNQPSAIPSLLLPVPYNSGQ